MTTIYREDDADTGVLEGLMVAVVGYGNQGRSWALNLRDSGLEVSVCVRQDESRVAARNDGFAAGGLEAAGEADVICYLVPDDAIPSLPISARDDATHVLASGYNFAFDRFDPPGDQCMVAPRMLGPEVRTCYTEGKGFITAVGVHKDRTGHAWERTLAIAKAIGGLAQGGLELSAEQEAVLDLAVEQLLSPALTHVHTSFVGVMLGAGIPLEAIMTELTLSGEIERNYRLLREVGFVGQLGFHSPASQYGQLSRRGRFDHLDVSSTMGELLSEITSGDFALEWDEQSELGHPRLAELWEQHANDDIAALESSMRDRLGEFSGDNG
jgi:ketol-acid reductoisomerase